MVKRSYTQHGCHKLPEYAVWAVMKSRCLNPRIKVYPRYGGRGITVCERWLNFDAFLADMGRRPSPAHEIERKDNDKGYEPGNCRWATRAEQMRNTCRTKHITAFGKTMVLEDWATEVGLDVCTLRYRVFVAHWPVEQALTEAPRNSNRHRRSPSSPPQGPPGSLSSPPPLSLEELLQQS